MARIFIGVAWPYANGPLHMGHVAGCYLPADIFARYHRFKGNEVLMVSGSDEHGTPITVTADTAGVSPAEIAAKYHKLNSESLQKLGISFDLFTETSTSNHREVVHDLFLNLYKRGYIYPKEIAAPYCIYCNRFLPDRYIEGECPHCRFTSARGDQCDNCGKTLEPSELVNAKCKLCNSQPELRTTKHFFLKLSAFESKLFDFIQDKAHWRPKVLNFTRGWLDTGLQDRAITRDLSWGVDIPAEVITPLEAEGGVQPGEFDNKRIYVWFEAVIGYLSASKEWAKMKGEPQRWEQFWKDAATKHYYFLAKDNIPFHTIIWPAMLIGYSDKLNLPYDVPANEYLTLNKEQFSKSRNHAIWVPNYLERYELDPIRYYLSINMPENKDMDFTWADFVTRNNNELVATYGNFVHRVLKFTAKHFNGTVPKAGDLDELELQALQRIKDTFNAVETAIEHCRFKAGMKTIMDLAKFGNKYFDERAPWSLVKRDKEKCGTVMHVALRIVKALAVLTYPYLPSSAEKLWRMLGYDTNLQAVGWSGGQTDISEGQKLDTVKPLFEKLDLEKILEAERIAGEAAEAAVVRKIEPLVEPKAKVKLDDFKKLAFHIGEIIDVKPHPEAEKLYVMTIKLGATLGTRQVVAGIRAHYSAEELKGKKVVVVTNLEPATIRGIVSEAMILAADDHKGNIVVIVPDKDIDVGAEVL